MIRVVWKYTIPIDDGEFTLELPQGAQFVSLVDEIRTAEEVEAGLPETTALYFVVDPEAPPYVRRFYARDTGQSLDLTEQRHGWLRLLGTSRVWLRHLGVWNVRHVWMQTD